MDDNILAIMIMADDVITIVVGIFLVFAIFFILNDAFNTRPNEFLSKKSKKKKKEDDNDGNNRNQ